MGVHETVRNHPEWPRFASIVHELAFLDGGRDDAFTLASGRHSRWFFDTKPVMMHPEAAAIMGRLLNLRIRAMGGALVGGLELGAVPLTAIVISSTDAERSLRGFMIRKSPKGRGGRKTNNPPGIEGTSLEGGGDVVILEDVTTTGGSSLLAIERIHQNTECRVVGVISILDREEGAEDAFAAAGVPFESLLTRSDIVSL
ncbi:MAG TPA: orotate phosphoribosyltransferase [Candidatus Poseidoniales archaeon]|nr:MAG TPA: orotate phosphoribosyltransferase [Candidatus Poseidoniales archaeon]|tara:strand:- start:3263 stop:3862 length:600 start_codon:yes stop_codon:yes gene_type:complete